MGYARQISAKPGLLARPRRLGLPMSWYNKGCSKRRGRQNDASRPQVKDEACGYLLSFGPEIEVLDPPEMREQIIRLAENMLEFYAQKTPRIS